MLKTSESFDEILFGNLPFKTAVAGMAKGNRFPHAILITGENGSGKKTAARFYAMAALCRNEGGVKPCMECEACRKIKNGIHPDVKLMTPGESGFYKVDEIRAVRHDTVIKPNEADRKIYIIDKADKMNEAAANSILKCLEEPPEGSAFVFLSEDESNLLPTVLSRTVRFRTTPLSEEYFTAEFGENGGYICDKFGGNLGLAKEKIAEKDSDFPEEFLNAAVFGTGYEVLRMIKASYMKKNEMLMFLGNVLSVFKNAILSKEGAPAEALSARIGAVMTDEKLAALADETAEMCDMAERNVSSENILLNLYIKIKS